MEKRFLLFLLLASGLLFLNAYVMSLFQPPEAPKAAQGKLDPDGKKPEQAAPGEKVEPGDIAAKPPDEAAQPSDAAQPKDAAHPKEVEQPKEAEPKAGGLTDQPDPQAEIAASWITLGSVDPQGKFRMAVTLTNRGAAIETIELSSQKYDLEESSGYLGYLAPATAPDKEGALVRAVAEGTPAYVAGLRPNDIITNLGEMPVHTLDDLRQALRPTLPGQTVQLQFSRDGQPQPAVSVVLGRTPLRVVRPEGRDPLSVLFTLERLGNQRISKDPGLLVRDGESSGAQISEIMPNSPAERAGMKVGDVITYLDVRKIHDAAELNDVLAQLPRGMQVVATLERGEDEIKLTLALDAEISGIHLRSGNWEVQSSDQEQVTFRWQLPTYGLEIVKQYRLAQVDDSGRDYHLTLDLQIRNLGAAPQEVAYQLDGPTGLPTEGWWFANKVGRTWAAVGVRDVAVRFEGNAPILQPALSLVGDEDMPVWNDEKWLDYIGVDAQYFAAAFVPERKGQQESWLESAMPLRVGPVPQDKNRRKLINTSCRLVSKTNMLAPEGAPLHHQYILFAGPKDPALLAKYGLGDLVYYGYFWWVAKPMLWLLDTFYSLVGNYGLAIIMLTVLVRAGMFPLSRKQAMSAQKMQALQPEIKKIAEKHKNDPLERQKATNELFKKHQFKPLGGCMLVFVQLPIFMGLYRSLMVGVQLRQAPLIPGISWASNLAAPDMLFRWERYLPEFLGSETGWLGPYFNVFPLITIALFLVQQKMFMPPPADEQAEMQQKMMKYMMIFMGFMFFKVPAGLCIYFIASSLWGIAERKLLPKVASASNDKSSLTPPETKPSSGGSNGSPRGGKEKVRRKR